MQIPAIVNEKLPNFVRQTYNVSCLLNVSFGFWDLISKYEHLLILPVKVSSPALRNTSVVHILRFENPIFSLF